MSNISVNSNNKYEVRAPPRRRAKKDDQEDQPIFLRKAYAMITSCPNEIGGWSEKGDTVVIKDVKAFSEKVIPTAYKHNNFSSFVRQLNFYGFRKVKSESLQNPNWWEFRHPSFVRGKPQLLSEIKRSMHFVPEGNSSGNVKEISELKSQVANLTEKLSFLNDQVERLTGAFNDVHVAPLQVKSEKSKKRKVAENNIMPVMLPTENIELRRMSSLGSQTYVNEFRSSGADLPSGTELENFDWNDEVDEMMVEENEIKDLAESGEEEVLFHEICGDLAGLSEKESDNPMENVVAVDDNHNQSDDMSRISDSFSEVSSVIDKLPTELQLRFVDKLAEVVGLQLASAMSSSQKVPVVKAELVEEARPQQKSVMNSPYPEYVLPSGNKAPEIALPLASAAISAFLMSNFRTLTQGMPAVPLNDKLGAK